MEAKRARRENLQHARRACFERILSHAPAMFSAAQLRVFLHALISLDPYTFTDEIAEHFAQEDENGDSTSEGVLTTAVDALPDDKLTSFALRLVLTGKLSIPREGEVDPLVEAEAAFIPAKTKEGARSKVRETPSIKAEKPRSKKATGKKQVAA